MSKRFQRKAKLRLVRRNVLQDFAAFSQPWVTSTRSPPVLQKRKTVFLLRWILGRGSVFFFLNLSSSLRNFLSTARLNERHGTQRTNGDLGFLALCGCRDLLPHPPPDSPLPPVLHSSRFAVTLFMESRGAGVRGLTEDEALKSRK